MLGKIPFVSMSERRLGGMENSSLRYLSAMRALEVSTSRIVKPSFSRNVRRLFPAGSMTCLQVVGIISKAGTIKPWKCGKLLGWVACYEFRTRADTDAMQAL